MKFKTDENLPGEAAEWLRTQGLDAVSVTAEQLSGAQDDELLNQCRLEGRILLTLDLDFANIRAYPPQTTPGLIVLRPSNQAKVTVLELIRRLLPMLTLEPIAGHLWLVDEHRLRIRGS